MMDFDLDLRDLTDTVTKLISACDSLPEIAAQVEKEALGHAILGARRNIYDTVEPEHYQRTEDYLRGLHAKGQATLNTASVRVWNDVAYAAVVEAGQEGMSLAMLQQLAAMQTDPSQPLTLGRSGRRWQVAAPVITGAQAYARYRLVQLFTQKVQQALR
ncbi:hypothetical protein [Deinococcus multiflagellatus]|uniref:Uncharacterized protein n=1 Tax=Deinococcus multiflagellatus TaxID=1656887 RepID=A0ABW1ZI50_9DEIO|nr:hypothetical protein [Deinococcus multiflagellatus]MBZ9713749.1 hypothetical protein [Deinococcus multiflagellatus]